MNINVKPSARLEKILNDLLQKLFEENAQKSKYFLDSFSSNKDVESWSTSPYSINCTENRERPTPTWSASQFLDEPIISDVNRPARSKNSKPALL